MGQRAIEKENIGPDTIGNLRKRPLFRPYDENFLFETRITALDKNDRRPATAELDYEMDDLHNPRDCESERSILAGIDGMVNPQETGLEQVIVVHKKFRLSSTRNSM